MANEVIWTKSKYNLMVEEGMLSPFDARVLDMHIRGSSRLEIADAVHNDVRSVDDSINRLKRIYDEIQKEFPDKLDPRCRDVYRMGHRRKR